jgi:hypothetical protein
LSVRLTLARINKELAQNDIHALLAKGDGYAAPVTDIAEALRRSLDAVPKPPCSESSGSSARKGQKRRPKG